MKFVRFIMGICVLEMAASGAANLSVSNFVFQPLQSDALLCPQQVMFDLANSGPDASGSNSVQFYLSRTTVPGSSNDLLMGTVPYNNSLAPGGSTNLFLTVAGLSQLTFPANASGEYYAYVKITPTAGNDSNLSNNTAYASSPVTVNPVTAGTYAVFASQQIVTRNMAIMPDANFVWNFNYGNSWLAFLPQGGFSGTIFTFTPGQYILDAIHLTSADASCSGGGYAPINISINGQTIVSNYDVALNSSGTHGYVTNCWLITLPIGTNSIEWYATNECSNYWLQRIEITKVPEFIGIARRLNGSIQLGFVGEPDHTNTLMTSTNLTNWEILTNLVTSTNSIDLIYSPPPNISHLFYQLRQQ